MIKIRQIESRRDLKRFITVGRTIYDGDSHWVEPLHAEVRELLGSKNPFWSHAKKALFLAEEDGRVVGRVAAIIDDNHNRFHDESTGFFGFFEAANRPEIARALFEAAEEWVQARGMTVIRGPMNPSTNEDCGLLVDGFDGPPRIMMPYNPPHYSSLIEEAGYRKAMDMVAYDMEVSDAIRERLAKIAARARKKNPGLEIRHLDMKQVKEEVDKVKVIYNDAWSKNWGFVPMTDAEFDAMASKMKILVDPAITSIAFLDGEPVAFLLALPDYNLIIKNFNGRLGPVKILRMLTAKNKLKELRLLTMGLRQNYRKVGIDALLYHKALEGALGRGYARAEFSWVLETNRLTHRAAKAFGGKVYRRYRIYEKDLAAK